jgi:hypothetical protein
MVRLSLFISVWYTTEEENRKTLKFLVRDYIKYTDAEGFIRLILGDGVVQTLYKVY